MRRGEEIERGLGPRGIGIRGIPPLFRGVSTQREIESERECVCVSVDERVESKREGRV
jgi:hypothetical protein